MHNKTNVGIKAVVLTIILFVFGTVGYMSYGQQASSASLLNIDKYSMSLDSRLKPSLRYFLVRLKGDNGVSIIDLDGNIISRNFMPVINSKGKVQDENWTTPVMDDIFCVTRKGEVQHNSWRSSLTVYRNAQHPVPVEGLSDLYSANIINPNLFPICRHGERIKFVDRNGHEKFTVMPIDGKEPYSVSPLIYNGIIIVNVDDVHARNEGAIDTTGKWVIYPEWNCLEMSPFDDRIIGYKGGKYYLISKTGKILDGPFSDDCKWSENYFIETFHDKGKFISNIYDLKGNYITTLDNADYIRPNIKYRNILLVRKDFGNGTGSSPNENLVDISKGDAVISKKYDYMEELPDGNYLAWNRSNDKNGRKCWYLRHNGSATPLPDNCKFPLRHPGMALFYESDINRFFVNVNDSTGYLCDFSGNKVGNILIEEYYNSRWEAEPVKSSYWYEHLKAKE